MKFKEILSLAFLFTLLACIYGLFVWSAYKDCPCKINVLSIDNKIIQTIESDKMFVFSGRSIIYHDQFGWHERPVANLLYEPR
jgi:hypothetical protein